MIEFSKRKELDQLVEKYTKYTKVISIIRFVLAFNTLTWLICLFSLKEYILYGILSFVSLIIFIIFALVTNKVFNKLSLLKNKKRVYETHDHKRKLDMNYLTDNGNEFLSKEDYKLSDLDVFGSKSLFQYLTSAKTKAGRELLAKQLSNPEKRDEKFKEAALELGTTEDTLDIEASLLQFTDEYKRMSYKELLTVVGKTIKFSPLFILPMISFVSMLIYLALIFVLSLNPYVLIAFPVINYILTRVCLKNEIFAIDSAKYAQMLENYQYVSNVFVEINFKSNHLRQLQQSVNSYTQSLKAIISVFNTLSSRKNSAANILLNSLVVYDLIIILLFNKNNKKVTDIEGLFGDIAEVELLISLANVAIDNDVYAMPTESTGICSVNMYHPLVKNCVKNSFSISGGVVLTGSNMSGKTTFMRTLGINQLLFNAGGLVFAEKFSSTFIPIFTSLRANDMLQEGISTFYAEILRMKAMNKAISEGNCLILVDEIFKGTNAYERIEGSKIVISKFNEKKVLFIVSTHDFELCDCPNVLNYHFNEEYHNDEISFDYKIKSGKCETTNALYLLKLSNII